MFRGLEEIMKVGFSWWVSVPLEEILERLFSFSATWERWKKALCQSRGDLKPQTSHIGTLITDFIQDCEEINIRSLSHPMDGIF